MDAANRETLGRLCRYLLRGPLALERLKQRADGMLTDRLKKTDRKGNTVLVLSPVERLMRVSSLIPAPGHPTRKYFGILAGGARSWAELLKRIWGLDALECPKCAGRMTAPAVVEDPAEIARYLQHTGQATVHTRVQAPPELAA